MKSSTDNKHFELKTVIRTNRIVWMVLSFFMVALFIRCNNKTSKGKQQLTTFYSNDENVLKTGKQLMKKHCYSCHMIEKAEIGPALGGVTTVRDKDWLFKFVREPVKMMENGDSIAKVLFERYKTPMPGFNFLSDTELEALFSYIDHYSLTRDVKYNPKGNFHKRKAMMTISTEPIPKAGLSLVIGDVATLPKVQMNNKLVRLGNIRYAPDDFDDLFYVNDHDGYIYRIENGKATKGFDIKDHFPDFISYPGLATGLGSFAFHPDFAENGLLYITHSESFLGKDADFEFDKDIPVSMQWVVSEFHLKNYKHSFSDGTWRELLRINVPGSVHGLQDINFNRTAKKGDKDYGLLYIGLGDGGATVTGNPELCHNLQSPLGTILRIDPIKRNSKNGAYGVPEGNPFQAEDDPKLWKEIYAYGFRNPHRFSWDPNDGRFFASEISKRSFEEVNLILPGKDYGWNVRDANIVFDSKFLKEKEVIPWDRPEEEFELPFAVYSHLEGQAVSGGVVYRGPIKQLKRKYIFGDIVSGRVFFVDVDKKKGALSQLYEFDFINERGERGLLKDWIGQRVDLRFGEDALGELYIMSKTDGKIRKVLACKEVSGS